MCKGNTLSEEKQEVTEEMKKVVVALPLDEARKEILKKEVAGTQVELTFVEPGKATEGDVQDADGIIGVISPQMAGMAPKLTWLQLPWAGAETFAGVIPEGAVLTNSSGAYGVPVAEHMLALTFSMFYHLHSYVRQQDRHEWNTSNPPCVIHGKCALVIGTGNIGTLYAKMMKGLGAYVIGISRTKKASRPEYDEQLTVDDLDKVLGKADIVAMVAPGGDATHHLIGEHEIRLMKDGAYIINAGRGSAIDPKALKDAVESGKLGGAGLDVFETEPLPEDDPLWDVQNIVMTPHVAGKFGDPYVFSLVFEIARENLRYYARGEELLHVVDRKLGY